MAQLTGNSIQSSYQGLLKTESNGAIGAGNILLTDGAGNSSKLTINTTIGSLQVEGPTMPSQAVKQTNWTKLSYPMGASAGQSAGLSIYDQNNLMTGSIVQDRYGSLYYENIYGENAEGHVFRSRTGAGAFTPAVIRMDTYNDTNNSNNWFTGYNQSVTNLSVSGQDLTLTRQGTSALTVTLPSAGVSSIIAGSGIAVDQATGDVTISATGGGGGGMEATLYTTGRGVNLGSTSASANLFRTTYVPDTYSVTTTTISNNQIKAVAMGLIEGQTIDSFGVYIGTATAGGVISAALYKARLDADGNIAGGDLEYNFGTIDATSTGLKVINGAGHTLGSTVDNTYWLTIWNGSGSNVGVQAVASTSMSGLVTHMSMYTNTAYRGTTFHKTEASLPTTLNTTLWTKSTDFPVFGLKFN